MFRELIAVDTTQHKEVNMSLCFTKRHTEDDVKSSGIIALGKIWRQVVGIVSRPL